MEAATRRGGAFGRLIEFGHGLAAKGPVLAWAAGGVLALCIFTLDLLGTLKGAIAVLYILVILIVAPGSRRPAVLFTGAGCALLTCISFITIHGQDLLNSAGLRFIVSLVAIAITTALSLRDRSNRTTLAEQARILALTHDTVIIRDPAGRVLYWNEGAERLYGWSQAEALGKNCDQLLKSEYPAATLRDALARDELWSGEITRQRRDGARLVLASRWLQRRTPEGEDDGIIETSADLTEQRRADAQRVLSEQRFSTMFHSAGFAAWESDWSEVARFARQEAAGAELRSVFQQRPDVAREAARRAIIREVNQAAVDLFEAPSWQALVEGNLVARFTPETAAGFAEVLASLLEGTRMVEAESRFITFAGRPVDVVLRVTLLAGQDDWSRVLVMAFDVTERNEARAKLEQASAELAHASRVSTLGQLAASIAHEVNQPLSAIITYAKSGKRWISRDVPEIKEVDECLEHVVKNGSRAAAIIARVHSLARKAAPQAEALDAVEIVNDAIALIKREAAAASVAIRLSEPHGLPPGFADRVQTQQVLVNLLMNAIQALRDVEERSRILSVTISQPEPAALCISIEDNGPGIALEDPAQLFAPFITTKADGMGIGLSICRSIVEGQGGRISARNNEEHGATFTFTIPVLEQDDALAHQRTGT